MKEHEHHSVLQRLSDAWGRRDIETILTCFSPDAEYHASVGPLPGELANGHDGIRQLVERMFSHDSGAVGCVGRPICAASTAFWKWRYELPDGSTELGCDFFEFRGGKIALKDAYRKTRAVTSIMRGRS
ncbi:MAG: nuclear transport factor 2 family protein [Parvibaculaceae bacterium]